MYVTGFVVDFALDTAYSWGQELIWYQRNRNAAIRSDSNAGTTSGAKGYFQSNTGWGTNPNNNPSGFYGFSWRGHKGAMAQNYNGSGAVMGVPHSLGQTPEMMWIKNESTSGTNWGVYHKDLSSGQVLNLNSSQSVTTDATLFNSTAPGSDYFTVGTSSRTNTDGDRYRYILFASVDGISKVGSYSGSDSTTTVTVGFQPRFLLVKRTDSSGNWLFVNTVKGWGSGNDDIRYLNNKTPQSAVNVGAPTSTGFTLTGNNSDWNDNGGSYIYYAHS